MTTNDLKEQAILLRQQGLTYPQISEHLNGALSVDWLKRNMKGVAKGQVEDECLTAVVKLATRPEGVSVYEANGVIMKHNTDKQLTKDQMRYIRSKAKAKNNQCLFRPDWVSTVSPNDSFQAFCAYVLHMQDEVDNLVRWYCDTFPDTKPSAVKYELLEYLKPETEKPVGLFELLVKSFSVEGHTVLDMFMGSGTTGVACKNLNRKFIGIEMDETYYNIAKDRILSK